MYLKRTLAFMVFSSCWLTPAISFSQYVHPPAPPRPNDFRQPPAMPNAEWIGPVIKQVPVKCWYAKQTAPNVPLGGTNETQKVSTFLPMAETNDTSFHQNNLNTLAGGGWANKLQPAAIPKTPCLR